MIFLNLLSHRSRRDDAFFRRLFNDDNLAAGGELQVHVAQKHELTEVQSRPTDSSYIESFQGEHLVDRAVARITLFVQQRKALGMV